MLQQDIDCHPAELTTGMALGDAVLPNLRKVRRTTFAEVPAAMLGDESDWDLLLHGRWQEKENILRLEGRAHILGIRHKLRAQKHRCMDHLCLLDNMPLVLSLGKGRSSAPVLNQTCREHFALSVASDCCFLCRWVPSEVNHSDSAS